MDVRSVFSDKQLLAKISREYEILKVSGEDSHGFLIPTQNVTGNTLWNRASRL
jgi:hypothetical protein